jgi:hypothetical protein
VKRTGAAGAARERAVRTHYREQGYMAFKVSDSAICDVVAMKNGRTEPGDPPAVREWLNTPPVADVLMIEVKGNVGGPWMNFRKPERDALERAAERAGAVPLLIHWPPRGTMRLYYAHEWPGR